VDSIGLCLFGRSVTNPQVEFIAEAINDAVGSELDPTFYQHVGRETLRMENEFNRQAGFTAADDDLPAFFYDEALPPTGVMARFRGEDVRSIWERFNEVGAQGVPDKFGRADSAPR
jgi:aldehyde:ferredoxin oxidoreductase